MELQNRQKKRQVLLCIYIYVTTKGKVAKNTEEGTSKQYLGFNTGGNGTAQATLRHRAYKTPL